MTGPRIPNPARTRALAAWEPPADAGDPVGLLASTFTFEPGFFEEELLGRFLSMESAVADGRAYLVEREERLGGALAVVLADRRHVERGTTLAWDLLPVPLPRQACQHSKVSVLAWERRIRLIVSSANLTEPAYRRNLEVLSVLDFHQGGDVPGDVLRAVIAFLERVVDRVPDPSDAGPPSGDGPRGRAKGLLSRIRDLTLALNLGTEWPRETVRVAPVFLEPGRGRGVFEQMSAIWESSPGPNEVSILTPFWASNAKAGPDTVINAAVETMGAYGMRRVLVYPPGVEEADGRWVVELPPSVPDSAKHIARLDLEVLPVPTRQGDEARPLHAKAVRWRRLDGRRVRREIDLFGSSNASVSGLGIGGGPRNIEANLVFVLDGKAATQRWFDACFPDVPDDVTDLAFRDPDRAKADEEGGPPPVPAFFRYAVLEVTDGTATVAIGLETDGEDREPISWSVSVVNRPFRLESAEFRESGRPGTWRFAAPAPKGGTEPPPAMVEVCWQDDGPAQRGYLPINAADSGGRCRRDLWENIDLETLIALLADGGPVYRQLAKWLRRNESEKRDPAARDLDPHKKVDTSNFLMQRIRRVSRAMEGMSERLSAPIASRASLEWRLSGPLSPRFFAQRLVESVSNPVEARFLVAEVALVVGRAARRVKAEGIPTGDVRAAFRSALAQVRALLPADAPPSPLDGYVTAALEEAGR